MPSETGSRPTLDVRTLPEWRAWLADHGRTETEIWLVVRRPTSAVAGITHAEAVEEALCFGWIDSTSVRRDADTGLQRFSPRGPRSTWSKINRELVDRLVADGRMTAHGQAVIDAAKASGAWDGLVEAQNLVVPPDLAAALAGDAAAAGHFEGFPASARRQILVWIAKAKRPETRERRIARTVELAAQGIQANEPNRR